MWKNHGESIEIQCRPKANFPAQNQLSVRKGLNRDEVFAVDQQNSNIISKKMRNRLKVYNTFPNVTLELTNLTVEDTGLYSCLYTRFDVRMVSTEGNGAVLLVVKGEPILVETLNLSPGNSSVTTWGLDWFCAQGITECCVCQGESSVHQSTHTCSWGLW